jgi:hypothetical protein
MANGYCLPLLQHIEAIAGTNPAKKLSPLGFTQMILSGMDGSAREQPINQDQFGGGHTRGLTVKYRTRPLVSAVSDTESACDTGNTPAYQEFTLPSLLYREYPLYIPNSLIRQYCKDASEMVSINGSGAAEMDGQTQVMREVYEMLVEAGGAMLASINQALVTQMATQWGENIVTGDNTATSISFSLQNNSMQDAFVRLMTDLRENEVCNDVMMVGNGPFANIELVRQWFANAAADNGINKAAMLNSMPRVWWDKDTKTIWGANQVGVFEKGSVHLMTRNYYTGSFAQRLANSNYFSMALPVNEYHCPQEYLEKLMFDVQLKEIDCPTQVTVNGVETTVKEGILLILKWNGSLFVKPTNLYHADDPLYGTNGTYRYQITESA